MKSQAPNENDNTQDLIGLVVHAYNNHIAAISGFNELALLHNSQSKTEELLELSLKSCKEASYLGQTLLASIGRLQLDTETLTVSELADWLGKLYPSIQMDLSDCGQQQVNSNIEWLVDCFKEMIEFLTRLAMVQDGNSQIKISCTKSEGRKQLKILIQMDNCILEEQHQHQLFNAYYSSKMMFGTAGIGLAKVQGFMTQTGASVEWLEDKGFAVILTSVN